MHEEVQGTEGAVQCSAVQCSAEQEQGKVRGFEAPVVPRTCLS